MRQDGSRKFFHRLGHEPTDGHVPGALTLGGRIIQTRQSGAYRSRNIAKFHMRAKMISVTASIHQTSHDFTHRNVCGKHGLAGGSAACTITGGSGPGLGFEKATIRSGQARLVDSRLRIGLEDGQRVHLGADGRDPLIGPYRQKLGLFLGHAFVEKSFGQCPAFRALFSRAYLG